MNDHHFESRVHSQLAELSHPTRDLFCAYSDNCLSPVHGLGKRGVQFNGFESLNPDRSQNGM